MTAPYENFLLASAASAAIIACGQASSEGTGVGRETIVNGEIDTNRHAVVLVAVGQGLCSGTIVDVDADEALGVVLTAAHCVGDAEPYLVIQGADPNDPDASYRTLDFEPHPGYGGDDYDIGMIRFVGADESTPVLERVRATEDDTTVGDTVTVVGYGATLPGPQSPTLNVRRFIDMSVVDATPLSLETTGFGSPCSGDSGGAVVRTFAGVEKVVAVHSSSTGPCLLTATESRVGSGEDFIDAFIAAPVGESCERCYKTLLSSGGACAPASRACNESPACLEFRLCMEGCDETACASACAAEFPDGLDGYIEYGACTCDPCELCDGNEFCGRIEDLRAYRDGSGGAGGPAPRTDAGDAAVDRDGGASAPFTDFHATGGGGCECRAGGRHAREPGGGVWLLGVMGIVLSGVRRWRSASFR